MSFSDVMADDELRGLSACVGLDVLPDAMSLLSTCNDAIWFVRRHNLAGSWVMYMSCSTHKAPNTAYHEKHNKAEWGRCIQKQIVGLTHVMQTGGMARAQMHSNPSK